MNFKSVLAVSALAFLGVMLYFSASAFFNMVLIPTVVNSLNADDLLGAKSVIVAISLMSALIAAFFSVFLFEMISGWKPWLSGFLFALPVLVLSAVFAGVSGVSMDIIMLYIMQFVVIVTAYWGMGFAGRWVGRRFFAQMG